MKSFLKQLRPYLLYGAFFSMFINILQLTFSVYMLQIYDRVLASRSVPTLLALFGLVVVLYAFLALFS